VAEIDPDLGIRNKDGQIESVRYTAVNAMLLNEFLKEHRKLEELRSVMAQQRKQTEALVVRLNEQEARIQKLSAPIEMRKSETEMLASDR